MNKKNLSAARIKKGLRYVRTVGLGFKTPKEATTGTYIDRKCPFTGDVAIRGRVFKYAAVANAGVSSSRPR
jgi:small subunit ribosomal protein S11e